MDDSLNLTKIHWGPFPCPIRLSKGWDPTLCMPAVGPSWRSPLLQCHDLLSRRRCRVDGRLGIWVFRHNGILHLPLRLVGCVPLRLRGWPITSNFPLPTGLGMPTTPPPIDLSRATKLKTVDLRTDALAVEWITRTLQTITSKYLVQIAIIVPPFLTSLIHTTVRREWEDLDHVLVQFWTSRSIRPVFKYKMTPGSVMGEYLRALLPELASREIVDVAEVED